MAYVNQVKQNRNGNVFSTTMYCNKPQMQGQKSKHINWPQLRGPKAMYTHNRGVSIGRWGKRLYVEKIVNRICWWWVQGSYHKIMVHVTNGAYFLFNWPWWPETGKVNLLKLSIRCLDNKVISIADLHYFAREIFGLSTDLWSNRSCIAFPDSNLFLLCFPLCLCELGMKRKREGGRKRGGMEREMERERERERERVKGGREGGRDEGWERARG